MSSDQFKHIYQQLSKEMLLLAYYYLKNKEDAQDVVQDLFLKIYESKIYTKINSEEELKAYCNVAIKHRCLDKIAKKKTGSKFMEHFSKVISFDKTKAFENELYKVIIVRLPPREKEIMELNLQGYKNEEISAKLNISYNTVRNTLSESRKKCQKFYHLYK